MTYAVAAAGTGGHVFPGLAVGEALIERGVRRGDILYVGGDRLEAEVYPAAGFPFLGVEVRGLQRRLTLANLALPLVVWRAVAEMVETFRKREVRAVLGMGGYVTIPAALAARRVGARLAVAEQNAEAGLANRLAGRIADRRYGAFPRTRHLPDAEWVGNPVRDSLARFDRNQLRPRARERYRLDPDLPVVGVMGGSLGAAAINQAVGEMARSWDRTPVQLLHLAGSRHAEELEREAESSAVPWRVVGFEPEMQWFYAASDLVVARAGGAVAELTVTATPAVLIPGGFGSGRHQEANAAALGRAGAAVVVAESALEGLAAVVGSLIEDEEKRKGMARAAAALARPRAGADIAAGLEELHG